MGTEADAFLVAEGGGDGWLVGDGGEVGISVFFEVLEEFAAEEVVEAEGGAAGCDGCDWDGEFEGVDGVGIGVGGAYEGDGCGGWSGEVEVDCCAGVWEEWGD